MAAANQRGQATGPLRLDWLSVKNTSFRVHVSAPDVDIGGGHLCVKEMLGAIFVSDRSRLLKPACGWLWACSAAEDNISDYITVTITGFGAQQKKQVLQGCRRNKFFRH